MTTTKPRVLLGFVLAPGIPGGVAGLLAAVLRSDLASLAFMLAFLAYVAAIAIGLPAYLYAHARGLGALKRTTVLAANVGLVAYVLIAGFVTLMNAMASPVNAILHFLAALMLLLVPIVYAVAVVWLFWLIAFRGKKEGFAP